MRQRPAPWLPVLMSALPPAADVGRSGLEIRS
jgi:hypothetical protein